MEKIGLVLEGGGMRGAYTAGALAWLIDNEIEFNYGVAISAGAVHLCSYLLKNKNFLYDISIKHMTDKKNVGIKPLLREGRAVGYDYMFDDLLYKQLNYDISDVINSDTTSEFGVYDCEKGDVLFAGKEYWDRELVFLKAVCTLPIAGRITNYRGMKILDGGIKCMIPIDRSVEIGNEKHFVISTKPKDYVRKKAGLFMRILMRLNYYKYPKLYKDYRIRHQRYHEQVDTIEALEKEGKAFFLRPTEKIPVARFSGDEENLIKLYNLGYKDMESRKDEFLDFIK